MLNVHCAVAAPLILLVIPVRVKMLSEEVQAIEWFGHSVEAGTRQRRAWPLHRNDMHKMQLCLGNVVYDFGSNTSI